jgi:hypothetical protein
MKRTAAVVALAVIAIGCSSGNKVQGGLGASSSASTARGKPLPESLSDVEAATEDVIDQVDAGGMWPAIVKAAADISAAWESYKPQGKLDRADDKVVSEMDAFIAQLSASAAAQDAATTEQAANDVSRDLIEVFALYDIGHPIQIARLDVIGRQIVIDVKRGDIVAAASQVAAAQTQYQAIKEDIQSRSADVDDSTEDTLDAMQSAADKSDAATLTSEAKAFLEIVDDMERLY